MTDLTVERSVWIDASPERVWQAVTEPDQLAQWFLPSALGAQMKRNPDGTLLVSLGFMDVPVAVLEDIDPPRSVTSRSLPDRQVATIYRLAEENGGTRVTITMTGLDSLSPATRRQRLDPSGAAWEKVLANLNAFIAGQEIPHPEGWIAALFGYRLEDAGKPSVERSIWLAAPRERVWQAITDPHEIQQWFSPGTPWRLSAAEVGGKLAVVDAETGADTSVQVIEKLDPPRQLVLRVVPESAETAYVTTWTLDDEANGTRLTLTYAGYEADAADVRHNNMEQNAFGFGMLLENLRAYLEGEALPYPGGF